MNYWTKKNEMKRKAVEHTKEMIPPHSTLIFEVELQKVLNK